jgi:uncharacterized protein
MDVWLMVSLGFFGSFGHCLGMCGPLSAAMLLSDRTHTPSQFSILNSLFNSVTFLNLGRLISYTLVGAAIGGVGNLLMAGGQLVGIGSGLRQGMAIVAGLMLIWGGLVNVMPDHLPKVPLLHPGASGKWHEWLSGWMGKLATASPLMLGLLWGLMPCGFLYVAQIKAAESSSAGQGAMVMLAFGVGTMPMMLGVGGLALRWSQERRSQLFRLAGWVTIAIGLTTLFRNSEMVDWTGHTAIVLLMLALIAAPLASRFPQFCGGLVTYRRAIGVGSFVCALAHTSHMLSHAYNWNWAAIGFLPPVQRWGMIAGAVALGCLLLPAITSFDGAVRWLGSRNWRRIHLLSVPALILACVHTAIVGSHYLGNLELTVHHWNHTIGLSGSVIFVLTIRIFRNHRLKS